MLQIQDLTVEKSRLLERVDTLEGGNDKFMELKENQVLLNFFFRQNEKSKQSFTNFSFKCKIRQNKKCSQTRIFHIFLRKLKLVKMKM